MFLVHAISIGLGENRICLHCIDTNGELSHRMHIRGKALHQRLDMSREVRALV